MRNNTLASKKARLSFFTRWSSYAYTARTNDSVQIYGSIRRKVILRFQPSQGLVDIGLNVLLKTKYSVKLFADSATLGMKTLTHPTGRLVFCGVQVLLHLSNADQAHFSGGIVIDHNLTMLNGRVLPCHELAPSTLSNEPVVGAFSSLFGNFESCRPAWNCHVG